MGYRMGGGLERSASGPEASGTLLLVPCRSRSCSSGVSLGPGGNSPFSGKICPSVVVPCSWVGVAEGVDATGRFPAARPGGRRAAVRREQRDNYQEDRAGGHATPLLSLARCGKGFWVLVPVGIIAPEATPATELDIARVDVARGSPVEQGIVRRGEPLLARLIGMDGEVVAEA